jgi:hypothetical protein
MNDQKSLVIENGFGIMRSIAGPNRDLRLDEPEVKACRENVRPAGVRGWASKPVKPPYGGNAITKRNPRGQSR